jgi:hypothetical protein
MFQAVPPPIIRSIKLYIQCPVFSDSSIGWQYLAFMYTLVLLMMDGGTA